MYTKFMPALEIVVFYLLLFLIFAFEGLGFPNGRNFSLYLIIFLPFFLFFLKFIKRESISFPRTPSLLFLLFFALSIPSLVASTDRITSIQFFLLYLSAFLLFIYAHNARKKLGKGLVFLIFGLSFIYPIYSMFIGIEGIPVPLDGYQMVFSKFGSHNHLGDFLLLPLVFCFYYLVSQGKKYLLRAFLAILFFLPYFLFSYSRSSYMSLVIVLVIMIIMLFQAKIFKFSPSRIGILIFTLSISLLFFLSVVRGTGQKNVNAVLTQKHFLSEKSLEGNRIRYFKQGVLSIIEKPVFGVGPGNFLAASEKNREHDYELTQTAHNIFVDILVENGIFVGIIFILIIIELLLHSEKNLYFFLSLAMLLNFQTDYTYRIFSFFILFFILMGLSYHNKVHN